MREVGGMRYGLIRGGGGCKWVDLIGPLLRAYSHLGSSMRRPVSGSRMCLTSEVRTPPHFPRTITFLPSCKLLRPLRRALRLTTAFASRHLTSKGQVASLASDTSDTQMLTMLKNN